MLNVPIISVDVNDHMFMFVIDKRTWSRGQQPLCQQSLWRLSEVKEGTEQMQWQSKTKCPHRQMIFDCDAIPSSKLMDQE